METISREEVKQFFISLISILLGRNNIEEAFELEETYRLLFPLGGYAYFSNLELVRAKYEG